jgi:hypothetical protein
MQPILEIPPPAELPGRYRERALFLLASAILVVAAHVADIVQAHGPNWPALGIRLFWAVSLVATAVFALRGRQPVLKIAASASTFLVVPFTLTLVAVTGGIDSPTLSYAPVLMVLLPVILPELLVLSACCSAMLMAGTLALLLYGGASPHSMLAMVYVSVFAIATGFVVARAHERSRAALENESAARHEALVQNERLVCELREALANVKTLKGLVPICSWCHRIRNDRGYWEQMEAFVRDHTEASFSHGICPDCSERVGN